MQTELLEEDELPVTAAASGDFNARQVAGESMIETIAVITTPETHAEYRKRIARAIQQTADCLRKPESPQQPLAVLPPQTLTAQGCNFYSGSEDFAAAIQIEWLRGSSRERERE